MKQLNEVLSYRNDKIINKFMVRFSVTKTEADELFQEMLKWLWLCATAKIERESQLPNTPKYLNVHTSMTIIDEVWHIFVLHTSDYYDFCKEYFGTFVHHNPSYFGFTPPAQEEAELQLSYIWEKLDGEKTLRLWYETYAEKYSPDKIRLLEKPYKYGEPCQAQGQNL